MRNKYGDKVLYAILYIGLVAVVLSMFSMAGVWVLITSLRFPDLTGFSIKRILTVITDFCFTFGLIWLIIPFCMSRVFEALFQMAHDELLEGVRLSILAPFKMTHEGIRQTIRRGDSVYAEDFDRSVCCLITQGDNSKVGVVKRLSDNSVDQFNCEDVSEEIIALSEEGIEVYDARVLRELTNRGFELQSIN